MSDKNVNPSLNSSLNPSSDAESLQALCEPVNSLQGIRSPAVGYFSGGPKNGVYLSGGAAVGVLKVLNTYHRLQLPPGIQGRVTAANDRDLVIPVEYGQELFRLTSETFENETLSFSESSADSSNESVDDTEEGYVVTAFTTGIFYSKPSPDAPSFVTVGQSIEKGKALGLIEVMKTFNHIIFQGTDTSATGTIKKVYVGDAQEVKLGQPLFLIE